MSDRYGPMTEQMKGALQWLASRGEMDIRIENRFVHDEISARTAWALERRGYAERRYTGIRHSHSIYITEAGRAVADELLPADDGDDDELFRIMEARAARRVRDCPPRATA